MTDNEFKKLVDQIDEEYGGPRIQPIRFFLNMTEAEWADFMRGVRDELKRQEISESKHWYPR